ncbi:hypothetical protein J2847_006692 [Azospirillum agricola]|nr:hypothetical protein [Azospirillum agricola]MBP2233354.1 hypothetical protein [Azospirillum agricola]
MTVGTDTRRPYASIQVATCSGCTAVIDGTPASTHQARKSKQRSW